MSKNTTTDRLLTLAEVEERLVISNSFACRLCREGRFPNAIKAGRHWRVPVSDVEAYIEEQRAHPRTGGAA